MNTSYNLYPHAFVILLDLNGKIIICMNGIHGICAKQQDNHIVLCPKRQFDIQASFKGNKICSFAQDLS